MHSIIVQFIILAALGLIISAVLLIFTLKKKLTWLVSIAAVLGYGCFSIIVLLYSINERYPGAIKRKIAPKVTKRNNSSCDCTWSSMALSKNDYGSEHKPSAQRISGHRYIKNEALRQRWIRSGNLVVVDEANGFGISKLDYSSAHLTPLARKRLYELGNRFRAELAKTKETKSYFIVSSITRSQQQQEDICRAYPNACTKDHSPHSYGVAFDIYQVFSPNKNCAVGNKALEKVLVNMQKENKIMLCPESKCIHVTVCG